MAGVAAPDRVAPEHAPPRLGYIPALDGLRALAVVAVLLYHADQGWIPGGFLGVDVFFVISGFLISGLVLDYLRAGKFTMSGFYLRRARRIFRMRASPGAAGTCARPFEVVASEVGRAARRSAVERTIEGRQTLRALRAISRVGCGDDLPLRARAIRPRVA